MNIPKNILCVTLSLKTKKSFDKATHLQFEN